MIKIIFSFVLLLSTSCYQLAYANNTEDIIKYRKDIMKSLGNHISIIAANLKGKVDINEDILSHSKSIFLTLSSFTSPVKTGIKNFLSIFIFPIFTLIFVTISKYFLGILA